MAAFSIYGQILVVFIGVLSSVIGIAQFYSTNIFPSIKGNFCYTTEKEGRFLKLLHTISENQGKILYFDNVRISKENYYCDIDLEQEKYPITDEDYIGFYSDSGFYGENDTLSFPVTPVIQATLNRFIPEGFLDKSDNDKTEIIKGMLNYYKIPKQQEIINDILNGVGLFVFIESIEVNEKNLDNNIFNNIYAIEDGSIVLDGPFQIKLNGSETQWSYHLSSPILDSHEKKQVACTKKEWNNFQKYLFCPFI